MVNLEGCDVRFWNRSLDNLAPLSPGMSDESDDDDDDDDEYVPT